MADLPVFESAKEGLESGAPFKLISNSQFNLRDFTDDENLIIRDALMQDTYLTLNIGSVASVQFFGEVLRMHKKLTTLSLNFMYDQTGIEDFAEILKQLNISSLNFDRFTVDETNFNKIFDSIHQIKSLTELNFRSDVFPNEEMSFAEILTNQGLKMINYSPRPFMARTTLTDATWHRIGELLSRHSSLEKINWECLTPSACVALGSALKTNTVLKTIQIENSCIQLADMTHICDGLKQNSTLESIILHSISMNDECLRIYFQTLANNGSKVKKFYLGSKELSKNCVRTLSESLKTNTVLEYLYLYKIDIDTNDWRVLCRAIRRNKSLKTIILNNNAIGVEGIRQISALLKRNRPQLLYLDLCRCSDLNNQMLRILVDGLKHNTTLKSFLISGTDIESEGCVYLCEVLLKNRTLTELDLSGLKIGHEGLASITKLLIENTTLRRLDISATFRWFQDLDPVLKALKINQTLTSLAVCSSEEIDEEKLAQAIQDNYALTTLEIYRFKKEKAVVDRFMKRNRDAKSEMAFKVAILSRNIARSRETMTLLPREIWLCILKQLTHPGMDRFDDIIDRSFTLK